MALSYYLHNIAMLMILLSTAVGLSVSSAWGSPSHSRDNFSRHIRPFYDIDGCNPIDRITSCSIETSLSIARPFSHSVPVLASSTIPTGPSVIVYWVQATTTSTSTIMLPLFTAPQVCGPVPASAEPIGPSDAASMLTTLSAPVPGTNSLLAIIDSLENPTAPPTTTSETPPLPLQISETSVTTTTSIAPVDVYSPPVPVSTVAEPTTRLPITTPFATQTTSSSSNADSIHPTMATPTSSSSFQSPEIEPSSSDGTPFIIASPSKPPLVSASIPSLTIDNSRPSPAEPEPTTFKTEVSSVITESTSASSIGTTSAATADSSSIEATGKSSSHRLHGSKKTAVIVIPIILVIVLALLGGTAWWLLTRRKEKKRVDRLAEKAVWLDQNYIDSIREKMMGMDEKKVGNDSATTSPMSKLSGIGRSNTLLGSKRLSVISDSIPTLRRSSKRIDRAEYLVMARSSNDANPPNVESLTHTPPLDDATNGGADGKMAVKHDTPTSAAGDDLATAMPTTMPQSPSKANSTNLSSTASTGTDNAATATGEETRATTSHQRSGRVASRLSHHLEQAVRRRSGVEELR